MRDYPINKIKLNGKTRWQLDTRELINGVKSGNRRVFKTQQAAIEAKQQYKVQVPVVAEEIKNYPKVRDAMIEFANSSYFLKFKKRQKSAKNAPETVRDRISRYNNYLDDFFGEDTVDVLTTQKIHHLSIYIQNLENKNGEAISQGIMYRLFTDVTALAHYLAQNDVIEELKIKDEDKVAKPDRKTPECWTDEEAKKYLNVIEDITDYRFFKACLNLGWRKSEGFAVKFKNIDFVNNTVKIEIQWKGSNKGERKPKTKESVRTIDCSKTVMEDFKKIKEERLKSGLSDEELQNEYVYVNDKNEPLSAETVRRHHIEYIVKSGVRPLTIHDMRHYYATTMLRAGKGIPYIQEQMGHSKKDQTIFRHYLSMVDAAKEKENNPFDIIYK